MKDWTIEQLKRWIAEESAVLPYIDGPDYYSKRRKIQEAESLLAEKESNV